MNAAARLGSQAQCRVRYGSGALRAAGRTSLAAILSAMLGLAHVARVQACSMGPTYASCMEQQEQEEQMRAEQQRMQQQQQEQMRAEQQRMQEQQQEQMRAEQQRMQQQQQAQQQQRQAQQQQAQQQQRQAQQQQAQQQQRQAQQQQQQAAALRTDPRPGLGPQVTPRQQPTPGGVDPRPHVGVPLQPGAIRPETGSVAVAPHSGVLRPPALSPAASQSVLHQINSQRTALSGVNKRPIPPGLVTRQPNGMLAVSASGQRRFTLRPDGSLSSVSMHGQVASFRPDGHLAHLHTGAMDVVYGSRGGRTVIVRGPDHSLIVSTGAHRGYVQRDVVLHGRTFVERTMIVGPMRTERLYGMYTFHGVQLTYYVPHFYYAPAFYGWAYYPWVVPVAYAWPWAAAPWYAADGRYFAVSPVYVGPYDWLTDYDLSQTLADEYAAQAAAAQAAQTAAAQAAAAQSAAVDSSQGYGAQSGDTPAGYAAADTPISPAIKQVIAQEVRQQLAADNGVAAEGGASAPAGDLSQVLKPNHVFVVDSDLSATTADQETCNLSAGNVLQLVATPASDSDVADLTVASSRRTDCPAGTHVTLSLDSIAEMQNAFSARLDDGLAALRQQQGRNGIPAAPPSAVAPPPRPTDYPPPAGDAAAALDSAQQQADQAQASVASQAFAANTGP